MVKFFFAFASSSIRLLTDFFPLVYLLFYGKNS